MVSPRAGANPLLLRLSLDLVSACLLLLALAYWWLGNAVHELAGTAVFALAFAHNVFNRRWWSTAVKGTREPQRLVDLGLTLPLLLTMAALLVTSLLISHTVSGLTPFKGGFTARQAHALAGYWSLVLVSVHLGIRWQRVMNILSRSLGLTAASTLRTVALRVFTLGMAAYGLYAWQTMAVLDKLLMRQGPDGWDFEASTAGFFTNWGGICALLIAVTHYLMKAARPPVESARRA